MQCAQPATCLSKAYRPRESGVCTKSNEQKSRTAETSDQNSELLTTVHTISSALPVRELYRIRLGSPSDSSGNGVSLGFVLKVYPLGFVWYPPGFVLKVYPLGFVQKMHSLYNSFGKCNLPNSMAQVQSLFTKRLTCNCFCWATSFPVTSLERVEIARVRGDDFVLVCVGRDMLKPSIMHVDIAIAAN